MLRLVLKCAKCKQEANAYEDENSQLMLRACLTIDFEAMTIRFDCPHCGEANILNLGKIESILQQRTRLPHLGFSRG